MRHSTPKNSLTVSGLMLSKTRSCRNRSSRKHCSATVAVVVHSGKEHCVVVHKFSKRSCVGSAQIAEQRSIEQCDATGSSGNASMRNDMR
jgi:hypothetical protein